MLDTININSGQPGRFEMDDCLKLNIRSQYSQSLTTELERLFVMPAPHRSIWADFSTNGVDAELDEIDQLGIRIRRGGGVATGPTGIDTSESMSDSCSTGSSGDGGYGSAVFYPEISPCPPMNKAHLLDILRMSERGRLKIKAPGSRPNKQLLSTSTQVCVFCRNNGESEKVYSSHTLKDGYGKTACPVLYIYTCPICNANGPDAHTIKYCPQNNHASSSSSCSSSTTTPSPQQMLPPPPPPVVEQKPPKPPRSNRKYSHQQQQQQQQHHHQQHQQQRSAYGSGHNPNGGPPPLHNPMSPYHNVFSSYGI